MKFFFSFFLHFCHKLRSRIVNYFVRLKKSWHFVERQRICVTWCKKLLASFFDLLYKLLINFKGVFESRSHLISLFAFYLGMRDELVSSKLQKTGLSFLAKLFRLMLIKFSNAILFTHYEQQIVKKYVKSTLNYQCMQSFTKMFLRFHEILHTFSLETISRKNFNSPTLSLNCKWVFSSSKAVDFPNVFYECHWTWKVRHLVWLYSF